MLKYGAFLADHCQVEAGSSAGDEVARSLRKAGELRRKAEWHERRAAAFGRGRQGEMAVANALSELTADGYRRLDDVRWPGRARANVDHVLIGPSGLFVIDAKNWSGRVDVRKGVLRQNGYRRVEECEAAVAAGGAVTSQLASHGAVQATPIICLCGDARPPAIRLLSGLVIISAAEIVNWIRSQPTVLPMQTVDNVYRRLEGVLQTASATAAAIRSSPVADFIPDRWPTGAVPREPSAVRRARLVSSHERTLAPMSARGGVRKRRFAPGWALAGRLVLLTLILDGAITAAVGTSDRVGDVVVTLLAAVWLTRLERRRPVAKELGWRRSLKRR